jgi:hypothetical protein
MSSSDALVGNKFDEHREPRIAPQRASHSPRLNVHTGREIVLTPGSEVTLRVKTEEGSEETIELSRDALLSAGLSRQSRSGGDRPNMALRDRHYPAITEQSRPKARHPEHTERDLIEEIREEYPDDQLVAVNKDTEEVIAVASDDHDLTMQLLSADYDEQETLIIRSHA